MKLLDILDKDCLISDLGAKNKDDAIKELASIIVQKYQNLSIDEINRVIVEREKLGSTGIGEGVAIPHGKLPGLDKLLVCFGRSTQGIDFESIDDKPAHLFFLLVAPENSTGVHLKALARISRLLKDSAFRNRLLEAKTRDQIYQAISEEDEKY